VFSFHFRLARLLRLRETARDESRQNLSAAQQAEDRIRARIAALNDTLTSLRAQTANASQPGTIEVQRLLEADRYEITVQSQLQVALDQLQAASAEVDRCQDVLVEADREVKKLEKLRQHQVSLYERDENRRAIKQFDEAAARRHAG